MKTTKKPIQNYKKLIEHLASQQHDIWSHWIKYMFSVCIKSYCYNKGKRVYSILIPFEKYMRWKRQMNTPYSKLSEDEKESDRDQANKIYDCLPNKCPIHTCGGIMVTRERRPPRDDAEEYERDWQSPDLVCTNCGAIYEFKGFKKKREPKRRVCKVEMVGDLEYKLESKNLSYEQALGLMKLSFIKSLSKSDIIRLPDMSPNGNPEHNILFGIKIFAKYNKKNKGKFNLKSMCLNSGSSLGKKAIITAEQKERKDWQVWRKIR